MQEDKKVKVWHWYKTNERGEHVCVEKRSSILTLPTFITPKKLVSSESKSIANSLQRLCIVLFCFVLYGYRL